MDDIDKKIIQKNLARRVGLLVNEIVGGKDIDEDVSISILVDTPSCYVDDAGVSHSGRLITVDVAFASEEDCGEDD